MSVSNEPNVGVPGKLESFRNRCDSWVRQVKDDVRDIVECVELECRSSCLVCSSNYSDLQSEIFDLCLSLGIPLEQGDTGSDALTKLNKYISSHTVPNGFKWPCFENGEPVKAGSTLLTTDGMVTCEDISLTVCDSEGGATELSFGECVRHAVVDPDNVPFEVGQTVWNVYDGREFTVCRLPRAGEYQAIVVRSNDGSIDAFDPNCLVHTKPVLGNMCRDCRFWKQRNSSNSLSGVCFNSNNKFYDKGYVKFKPVNGTSEVCKRFERKES